MAETHTDSISVQIHKPPHAMASDTAGGKGGAAPLFKQTIKFNIYGVSQGIGNGIIRVAIGELSVKRLTFSKYNTTDLYANEAFIKMRMEQIPIDQDIPANAQFKLEMRNDKTVPLSIRTHDMVPTDAATDDAKESKGAKPPCNDMELLAIGPGRQLIIGDIHVITGTGGRFGAGYQCTMKCIDKDARPTLDFDPTSYEITLHTNGDMPIAKFALACIDNIATRLEHLIVGDGILITDTATNIMPVDSTGNGPVPLWPLFRFNLGKETHTTREIIFNMYCREFPDGDLMCTNIDDANELIIEIRAQDMDDAKMKIKKSIQVGLDKMLALKKSFTAK